MKKTVLSTLAVAALTASAQAQVDVEVVLSTFAGAGASADWSAISLLPNSFVATPDAEIIATNASRVFLKNGSDTDDSDGDGILSFDLGTGATNVTLLVQESIAAGGDASGTNSVEAALGSISGWAIDGGGEDPRGMDVTDGGDVIYAFDTSGDGQAALLRIASTSTITAPSVEVLFGDTTVGNDMDGASDIVVVGNTVYVLQVGNFGAPEDRVVSFDLSGTPPLSATTVLSEADLFVNGLIQGTDLLRSIESDGTNLYVAFDDNSAAPSAPNRPLVVSYPIAGGSATTVFTQDQLTNGDREVQTGGLACDGNFLFVQADSSAAIYRVDTTNIAAGPARLIDDSDIESDPDYVSEIAGGPAGENSFGIAAAPDGFLYITVESSASDTDSVVRIPQNAPTSVPNWNLY